jgi:G3E family GTPase
LSRLKIGKNPDAPHEPRAAVLIACVGGFLGAGKTTALIGAARECMSRRLRVGVITNDQGSHLVDSGVMRALGLATEEIAGGCFCCRFDEFVASADRMIAEHHPDVILAEAVGSCTDLSATVYQPLFRYHANRFQVAPLSVLVEPARLRAFLEGGSEWGDDVAYLFQKQLAEADLIILNKSDLIDSPEREHLTRLMKDRIGNIAVHAMSARTTRGVAQWVDQLLTGRTAGTRSVEIDYATYARAEASLGWLNATIDLASQEKEKFHPGDVAEAVLRQIQEKCVALKANIAHVKVLVATADACDRISVIDNEHSPEWSGEREFPSVAEASLIVNARVGTSADMLKSIVQDVLLRVAHERHLRVKLEDIEAFAPPPPTPRYRLQPELEGKTMNG